MLHSPMSRLSNGLEGRSVRAVWQPQELRGILAQKSWAIESIRTPLALTRDQNWAYLSESRMEIQLYVT